MNSDRAPLPADKGAILPWLAVLCVPLVAWVKDAAVIVLALAAIAVLATPGLRRAALAPPQFTPALVLGLAFLAWTLIAFAWAPARPYANWLKAYGTVALTWIVVRSLAAAPAAVVRRVGQLVVVGTAALFGLLLVERLTGGALIGLVRSAESPERHFNILSAGLALLTCLAFPAADLLWRRRGTWHRPLVLLFAVLALGISYRMDAAPFGLAAAAAVYATVWYGGRAAFAAVLGLLALAALAWGAIGTAAWHAGLHTWLAHAVAPNWGLRVEIWHRTWELITARPLLGYGFDAARAVGVPGAVPAGESPDVRFLHTHNGLLQIWLELGAVGVALFLAWAGAALAAADRRLPDREARATAAATIVAAAAFWEVSFGIWQGWWLAALGLTLAAVVTLCRTPKVSAPGDP
jgi:O-antigen ligase